MLKIQNLRKIVLKNQNFSNFSFLEVCIKKNKVELFFKVCRGHGRRSDSFDDSNIDLKNWLIFLNIFVQTYLGSNLYTYILSFLMMKTTFKIYFSPCFLFKKDLQVSSPAFFVLISRNL